ncbi:uncharacterized protein LOC134680575 [Cydia fagiglandana]|uniref:uncharacterized protein LOC134680575 n=1 Tax=Cydia fagiglandana TaxID=1458189 RepID=UPI002FEE5E47
MPSTVTLEQLQCGPKLTLKFMVSCSSSDIDRKASDAVTEPINVNNLALVRFKFHYALKDFYHLISTISTKKKETVKYSTVTINVTCDTVEKECICSDDWTEIELISKVRDSSQNVVILVITSLQVNITTQETACPLLQSLKLYEDDEFTDFQLHVADGTVAVHKSVLSIHSDVFKTMLRGKEWKETKQNTIELAGVTLQTLQHLKSYMYLSTLPDEGLEDLLLLAALYMMDHLKAHCIQKLVENVTPEKMDRLIEFACQNNMPDLVRALINHSSMKIE